ncbi:hypothetical protein SNEBB_002176 [Seison nebaliae]|nr:hypothetical protein SNEBB_002176 [Seison nebaliae]
MGHGMNYWMNLEKPNDKSLKYLQMLFIFTTGRSGSTTLQYLLNHLPRYWIGGEMGKMLTDFQNINDKYFKLRNKNSYSYLKFKDNPKIMRKFRELFLEILIGTENISNYEVLGQKELLNESKNELEFLLTLFPKSKYIFVYRRNINSYQNSGFMKREWKTEHFFQVISRKIEQMKTFQKSYPKRCRTIIMEDMTPEYLTRELISSVAVY